MDLVLVGGGLANALVAYRLATLRPDVDFVVLERGPALGGHHTWSFHEHDLTEDQWGWMRPLVEYTWPRHEVRFPSRTRTLHSSYHTISSDHLAAVLGPVLGGRLRLGADVGEVSPHHVELADGSSFAAAGVIDGRGDPRSPFLHIRYQKFLGRFFTISESHKLDVPILMDATVPQTDGYRFIYALPLSDRSLLIEDTYYSDTPTLEHGTIRAELDTYASANGWRIDGIADEETGVLPIVLSGDIERFWKEGPAGVPRSGMRAALFHPTTGYSLPEAVRFADDVCRQTSIDSEHLYPWTRRRSLNLWKATAFFRFLNRMLFNAAEPSDRYRVMERFYGLGQPLIERFYAGRLNWRDKLRILTGKPPVPIGRALGCLMDVGESGPGPTTDENSTGRIG